MTIPALSNFAPKPVDIGGRVYVAVGAGFADVDAPKLSELSVNMTCSVTGGINGSTDIKTQEFQRYCDLDASETFEKRVRKLDTVTFYVDATDNPAFETLIREDGLVSLFFRPFTLSDTPLAVGDEGTAWNATVRAIDWGSTDLGSKYTHVVQFTDVSRSKDLMTALG